jgi:hypothetical protein
LKKTNLTAAGYDQDRSFILGEIAGNQPSFQTVSRTGKTVDSGVISPLTSRSAQLSNVAKAGGK